MRRAIFLVPVLAAISMSVGACADSSRADAQGMSTGVTAGPDETGDGGDGEGADDGDLRLDVAEGMGTAGDGGGDMGCRGIDFLFVVDNSGSMKDEQENLAASFPGFVDTMQAKVAELEAGDFHVMVVDSDAITIHGPGPYCSLTCEGPDDTCYAENGSSQVPCAFSTEAGCFAKCAEDMDAACAAGSCRELLGCDECGCDLGAGQLDDPEGNPCNVEGGKRYIQTGQPDLHETFACLAEVGTGGDGAERIAGAAVEALAPEKLAKGECNDGFVRDDAILVVTFITDEDDEGSSGDPNDWYDAVVAAKGDDADAVVVLGLMGDYGQPGAVCEDDGGATGAYPPRLDAFVQSFPRSVTGSVCEPNYAGFFADAVELIKDTCEVYVPPQG